MAAESTLVQVSTIDALLAGLYDGVMPCKRLIEHGNHGLGTFDHLDGEMVVLDGRVYQITSDGRVKMPPLSLTTPFAAVMDFSPEKTAFLEAGTDYDGLRGIVDAAVNSPNVIVGIRVEGRFRSMTTRSVPAQEKPYPPLVAVAEHQPVFHMSDVAGTLVGFRSPEYVAKIGVPGYHLHFLSKDRARGGHVLNFVLGGGTVKIDVCRRFLLLLPGPGTAFDKADLTASRSAELEKVER
jgi:acetolactate decarboxylase